MLIALRKWIKWIKDITTKSIPTLVGLAVSGVLGYFVIKLLLKYLWNISDDIGDNISDMMDE